MSNIETSKSREVTIARVVFNGGDSESKVQAYVGVPIKLSRIMFRYFDVQKQDMIDKSLDKLIFDREHITFKYIVTRTLSKYTCTKYPELIATMQCVLCGEMYSSEKAFIESWPQHHARHVVNKQFTQMNIKEQRETIQSTITSLQSTMPLSPKTISYTPTEDDYGKIIRIKIEPYNTDTHKSLGPAYFIEFKPVLHVMNQPLRVLKPLSQINNPMAQSVSVMSYNLLADIYTSEYKTVDPGHLDWYYRRVAILNEVRSYNPDICCFQEVESDYYDSFWKQEMKKMGYIGYFKKKTRDIFTNTYKMDGCATFYREDRFNLVEKHDIEFKNLSLEKIKKVLGNSIDNTAGVHRVLKDNIALVLVLELKNFNRFNQSMHMMMPTAKFVVGNTHIMANPKYPDVKVWQVQLYLNEIAKISKKGSLPMILAGDYNSTPDSGAYQLLKNGFIDPQHKDLLAFNNKDEPEMKMLIPNTRMFKHDLNLNSAYGDPITRKEPNYTTRSAMDKFEGTLDYIFYSGVALTDILDLPNVDEYIPNGQYPSDHFSIMSKFVLLTNDR